MTSRSATAELPAALEADMSSAGYVVFKSAIDMEVILAARAEVDDACRREEERFGRARLHDVGQLNYTCDFIAMGPATRAILDHDVVHECVTSLLGQSAQLAVAQGIVLQPGQGRGSWPRRWHADLYHIRAALPDPHYCFGVNVLVVLDAMSSANGATCVVEGSHGLIRDLEHEGAEMESICRSVEVPAGSVILMDAGLWHAAGHNTSEHPRRVLKMLFVRGFIRPQIDYELAIDAELRPNLSERVSRYLRLSHGDSERRSGTDDSVV